MNSMVKICVQPTTWTYHDLIVPYRRVIIGLATRIYFSLFFNDEPGDIRKHRFPSQASLRPVYMEVGDPR